MREKSQETKNGRNILATGKITTLIATFAGPAIISNIVGALYNIVDQIFIGQGVGELGNAATNVAFPLSTICTAVALLIGIGAASNFNLELGKGNEDKAREYIGNGITYLLIFGISIMLITLLFLEPLLNLFGATESVLPFALTYTSISAFGFPFIILVTGGSNFIRSDGSPKYAMAATLTGAILNTILDPLFIFTLDMGIAGGALATVIGQIVSAIMVLYYFKNKFKTIDLTKDDLKPRFSILKTTAALGAANAITQVALTLVQITMNNSITHYGALSQYGADTPLAVIGVVSKVNMIFISIIVGIAQGCQPINGYNYGAKNYDRVKETYFTSITIGFIISAVALFCFQVFPKQIMLLFDRHGNDLYIQFGVNYLRIYLSATLINGFQIITANFFSAIGKPNRGIFMSLTRQILFLIPLIILLPRFFGIDGIMFAGPVADVAAFLVTLAFMIYEIKELNTMIAEQA